MLEQLTYLNSNIEIHKLGDKVVQVTSISDLNSNIEIHKYKQRNNSIYFLD